MDVVVRRSPDMSRKVRGRLHLGNSDVIGAALFSRRRVDVDAERAHTEMEMLGHGGVQ
jgi:hypothetical protein